MATMVVMLFVCHTILWLNPKNIDTKGFSTESGTIFYAF